MSKAGLSGMQPVKQPRSQLLIRTGGEVTNCIESFADDFADHCFERKLHLKRLTVICVSPTSFAHSTAHNFSLKSSTVIIIPEHQGRFASRFSCRKNRLRFQF